MRGYCVYTDEPPGYNVFYLFQLTDHAYDRTPVTRYDADAEVVVDELRALSSVEEAERYLSARHALDAAAVERILEQL